MQTVVIIICCNYVYNSRELTIMNMIIHICIKMWYMYYYSLPYLNGIHVNVVERGFLYTILQLESF